MARDSRMPQNDDDESNETLAAFLGGGSSHPPKRKIDSLVDTARRSDDPLLGALSLVLAANHDYAKSVSSLLSTDLSQGQSLIEIKEKIATLSALTEDLVVSQNSLLVILHDMPKEQKELLELIIFAHEQRNNEYSDAKFSKVFEAIGLKKDGEKYGEADGLIRKVKYLVSKQVWAVIIGMLFYNIALWILHNASNIVSRLPK